MQSCALLLLLLPVGEISLPLLRGLTDVVITSSSSLLSSRSFRPTSDSTGTVVVDAAAEAE